MKEVQYGDLSFKTVDWCKKPTSVFEYTKKEIEDFKQKSKHLIRGEIRSIFQNDIKEGIK